MPIKRHEALQPLSREHHHALLLCWKIRTGLVKKIAPERIKNYAGWFSKTQLFPHFEIEEQHVFPLLDRKHEAVMKALNDHQAIRTLLESNSADAESLLKLADALESHIRFEERILFNEIQKTAPTEALQKVAEIHSEQPVCDNADEWKDNFWE